VLADDDAYDVADYIISQKRPQKANLDKDFPVLLEKPIDTPYGPYIDGFSLDQHRYGPFGPIRTKMQELAAASGTVNAGEPEMDRVDPNQRDNRQRSRRQNRMSESGWSAVRPAGRGCNRSLALVGSRMRPKSEPSPASKP
jgi:hypothetical protein